LRAVGIDLDDVLADFTSVWLRVLEDHSGVKVDYNDIKAWHIEAQFPNLNRSVIMSTLESTWTERHDEIQLSDRRIPTIIDNLRQFYKVYITTAALASDDLIINWLAMNGIKYDRLVHVKHHSGKLIEEVYVYVDDNPIMAKEFSELGKKVVLFRRPWNESTEGNDNILIADNWDEVEQLLIDIADRRAED